MAQSDWDAMLYAYIYDHLVKKEMHKIANSFLTEGKVIPDPVETDTPGGLLFAWWSKFWDIYNAKTKEKHAVEYGLNVYVYDYLVRKKLHNTAKTFMSQVKLSPDHVAIDTPGGFLLSWWSVFWTFFIAKTNFESAAEVQQGKEKEQQMQMQQLQMLPQAHMQRRHPSLGGPMKQFHPRNTETFQTHMDAGTIQRTQQTVENRSEVNLGASPRQLPLDSSTVYGQGILQSKPGMGSAGLNPGVGAHPVKGCPLTLINMPPVQQSSFQQPDPLLSQQNNSTWTRYMAGHPPNSQPSTPSTHTPVEGVAITGNMQHVDNMPKGPMTCGSDAIGGLASSANQLMWNDMEGYEDVGFLEDNIDEVVASALGIVDWTPYQLIEVAANPVNTVTSQPHMDPKMAPLKSGTTYHGNKLSESLQQTPVTPASALLRGCNCKKSKCMKKYCGCFQVEAGCSMDCRCVACGNPFGSKLEKV